MQLFFKILFMSAHLLIKFLNLTKRKIHIHTIASLTVFMQLFCHSLTENLLKRPVTPFINKPDSLRDLTVFISSISSFEIISVLMPDPKIFFWIAASVTDTAAFNPNGTKMLLADGLSAFFIQGKPVFSNGTRNLPRILPDCPILYNWVFDNLF